MLLCMRIARQVADVVRPLKFSFDDNDCAKQYMACLQIQHVDAPMTRNLAALIETGFTLSAFFEFGMSYHDNTMCPGKLRAHCIIKKQR